jgi:ABC-type tungstate transport system substrate-binding protein
MGAGATLVGLIGGLLVVAMTPEREAFRWAMVQVAASSVRMLATLAVGFGLYKSLEPGKIGLWAPLLLTSLAVLVAEVMVFLPVLRGAESGARAGGSVTEASA